MASCNVWLSRRFSICLASLKILAIFHDCEEETRNLLRNRLLQIRKNCELKWSIDIECRLCLMQMGVIAVLSVLRRPLAIPPPRAVVTSLKPHCYRGVPPGTVLKQYQIYPC